MTTQSFELRESTQKLLTQVKDIFMQDYSDSEDLDTDTIIAILASGFLEGVEEDNKEADKNK